MEREKLIKEHSFTLESLLEKEKFVYSEEFYNLDEQERQKYIKDKMATESHLNSLSSLLWQKNIQFGGMQDFLPLLLLTSMFGNNNFSTYSLPKLNIDENKVNSEEQAK